MCVCVCVWERGGFRILFISVVTWSVFDYESIYYCHWELWQKYETTLRWYHDGMKDLRWNDDFFWKKKKKKGFVEYINRDTTYIRTFTSRSFERTKSANGGWSDMVDLFVNEWYTVFFGKSNEEEQKRSRMFLRKKLHSNKYDVWHPKQLSLRRSGTQKLFQCNLRWKLCINMHIYFYLHPTEQDRTE